MSDYHVQGNVVERLVKPRFQVVFVNNHDGSFSCDAPEWIDAPPRDIAVFADLLRQAGDALMRARGW